MRLPRPKSTVVFKELSEGSILLSTSSEVYFGLNAVGTSIWKLLPPASTTLEELVDRIALAYPEVDRDRIRVDVNELLDALRSKGLVEDPPGGSDPA